MTCPANYQVEVDDNWNPKGFRSSLAFTSHFDVGWQCLMMDQTVQEQCNKILCMGAMVSMQGEQEKNDCIKDRTDCTCAENLRESCKGGLKRLREQQCTTQCTHRWCDLMCQRERSREYTGVFTPDNVENPFSVLRCEAVGTQCVATCTNDQRRLSVERACGEFDIWDDNQEKFLVTNSALCGSRSGYTRSSQTYQSYNGYGQSSYSREVFTPRTRFDEDQVCMRGQIDEMEDPQRTRQHTTYRPSSCVQIGSSSHRAATMCSSIATFTMLSLLSRL